VFFIHRVSGFRNGNAVNRLVAAVVEPAVFRTRNTFENAMSVLRSVGGVVDGVRTPERFESLVVGDVLASLRQSQCAVCYLHVVRTSLYGKSVEAVDGIE